MVLTSFPSPFLGLCSRVIISASASEKPSEPHNSSQILGVHHCCTGNALSYKSCPTVSSFHLCLRKRKATHNDEGIGEHIVQERTGISLKDFNSTNMY